MVSIEQIFVVASRLPMFCPRKLYQQPSLKIVKIAYKLNLQLLSSKIFTFYKFSCKIFKRNIHHSKETPEQLLFPFTFFHRLTNVNQSTVFYQRKSWASVKIECGMWVLTCFLFSTTLSSALLYSSFIEITIFRSSLANGVAGWKEKGVGGLVLSILELFPSITIFTRVYRLVEIFRFLLYSEFIML